MEGVGWGAEWNVAPHPPHPSTQRVGVVGGLMGPCGRKVRVFAPRGRHPNIPRILLLLLHLLFVPAFHQPFFLSPALPTGHASISQSTGPVLPSSFCFIFRTWRRCRPRRPRRSMPSIFSIIWAGIFSLSLSLSFRNTEIAAALGVVVVAVVVVLVGGGGVGGK